MQKASKNILKEIKKTRSQHKCSELGDWSKTEFFEINLVFHSFWTRSLESSWNVLCRKMSIWKGQFAGSEYHSDPSQNKMKQKSTKNAENENYHSKSLKSPKLFPKFEKEFRKTSNFNPSSAAGGTIETREKNAIKKFK